MRYCLNTAPAVTSFVWLLVVLGASLPVSVAAQAFSLQVTLHDAGGRALTGITLIVRDEDGNELTRAVSDATGAASFAGLPAVVRVAVTGQARSALPLYQLGDDAQGVRLDLSQGRGVARLDLRVERDGLVLPDPATMLSLEQGGPVVEEDLSAPTALLATPAPLPSTAPSTAVVSISLPAQPAEEQRAGWAPLATVLLVAIAAGVMRLVQRKRDAR